MTKESFKSLKYIKVRLENYLCGSRSKEYELVQPDDILYLEHIGDLIKRSKDVLIAYTSDSMGGTFYNKNLLKDLRKKGNSIIFRDRYELDSKDFIGFGSKVLCIPESHTVHYGII